MIPVRSASIRRLKAFALNEEMPPDILQVGNEINHGMLRSDRGIARRYACGVITTAVSAVKAVDPSIRIMLLRIPFGGQGKGFPAEYSS